MRTKRIAGPFINALKIAGGKRVGDMINTAGGKPVGELLNIAGGELVGNMLKSVDGKIVGKALNATSSGRVGSALKINFYKTVTLINRRNWQELFSLSASKRQQ
ncbi:hypothetical protein COT29_01500 [Candidatus Micrarchaeota archaeon CG08_land_8_20_14_0_20_59_11]|nr:MAG: hypothetical protein COT29_01500 [Candidatus Micrarchaeota archaeon CG08_land_8_20_14_0_20_59_11]